LIFSKANVLENKNKLKNISFFIKLESSFFI
jgi:hypothetical protein